MLHANVSIIAASPPQESVVQGHPQDGVCWDDKMRLYSCPISDGYGWQLSLGFIGPIEWLIQAFPIITR